jgi:3-oxoadipate enol-lactonase
MPDCVNGDVTIHYEDEGSGPPVVLIHGHTLDRRLWEPVLPMLRAAGLRVVRPDLRGHGLSFLPDRGYHLSNHALDMAAVFTACTIDRATVVGHSIGGAVGLEMALTMPEKVGGLVLVSTVMPDRPFEDAFMDNLREVARTIRSEGVRAAMEGPWARSPLFERSFADRAVREAAAAITRDFPGAEYLATSREGVERNWKTPERLGEIAVPTEVLVGEREMPGFRAYSDEAAAGIPGARLDVVENSGHLLPLEAPDRVAAAICDVAKRSNVQRSNV